MATAAKTHPMAALQALGQSVWLDYITRKMLDDGELKRLIESDGLQGMTSNPTIFEKAIGQGTEYDAEFEQLVAEGRDDDAVYQALTISDIQRALDLFRPLYDATDGGHGFVSLEVSPHLAHNTEGTIAEARTLWRLLDRPNAMIKVPGTPEGLPAIEQLLFEGVNVNITLLFSVEAYEKVAHAYLSALRRRVEAGQPIDRIASVASFFVSRIDTEVDRRLDAKLQQADLPAERRARLERLKGQAAIANAKNAYTLFQRVFEGPRFTPLKAQGAKVQRVLWASVSTKNPNYRDTLYVDELIGPHTVSTMPPNTFEAFKDHGQVRLSLLEDQAEAPRVVERLAEAGIDLNDVTAKLLRDGVDAFAASFDELMATLARKRREIVDRRRIGQTLRLTDPQHDAVARTLAEWESRDAMARLWNRDSSLWTTEPAASALIGNALGWLTVAEEVRQHADELTRFADEIAEADFRHVVLLGMGGSSLGAEVLRRTNVPMVGRPELIVLDSTVPATIRRVERAIDPAHTLFIVASKSGTTAEPSAFLAYFFDVIRRLKGSKAGENFVAITDPGTRMEEQARRDGFRRVFLNPSDIGGRYSVLSYFGMVPAALMGLDAAAMLDRAQYTIDACRPEVPIRRNFGAQLGAALGALATLGRDKVTLVTPPPLEALGLWIEQLLAESTGKQGRGLLPVAGEPLTGPASYGDDRVFVQVRTIDAPDARENHLLKALADAGHPVLDLVLSNASDLGAEFFRWEVATALAGQTLGINPFDQPNVQESKDHTNALLRQWIDSGTLPEPKTIAEHEGLRLQIHPDYPPAFLAEHLDAPADEPFIAALKALFATVQPGHYVAITQFFDESEARDAMLQELRAYLRDTLQVATTTGYGPRFLHSTGQLHKGGPDTGVFLQLTADDGADVPIPGQPYGFATLALAQARGDFHALASRGRRALSIALGPDVDAGLRTLRDLITHAVR